MKKIIIASIAAITVSAFGGTFDTSDGFSITLPDGWVEVPASVIANYSDRLGGDSTNDEMQVAYDYGYQMNESGGWLSYPCILVHVNASRRFPTGSMQRLMVSAASDEASLSADKTLMLEVREQGAVKCLLGRQLTENGFIELTGFAPVDAFDEYVDVFKGVFSSLVIDESIRYQPRLTDNAPVIRGINVGKVVVVCIQSALVGGVLGLIYFPIRRKLRTRKSEPVEAT